MRLEVSDKRRCETVAAKNIKGQSWNTLWIQTDLACSFLAASHSCTTLPPKYYRQKISAGCIIHVARSKTEWRLHCSCTSPATTLDRIFRASQGIHRGISAHISWVESLVAPLHFLQIMPFSSLEAQMDHLYLNHLRVNKSLEIFILNFQWAHSLIFRSQSFPSLVSLLCIRNISYTANHLPAVPGCILSQLGNTNGHPFILLG